MKKLVLGFLISLVFCCSLLFGQSQTFATNPSNLMDDGVFNRTSSMSATQIDNLLNSYGASCISGGNGFTTLDPRGYSGTSYQFGGNVSAGKAIYDISQHYDVNPQVIVTTLQKEQSVVTGSAGCHPNTPNSSASQNSPCGSAKTPCTEACPYSGGCVPIAMSYACPNYCYAGIEGFSNQISGGTWVLRWAQERAYGNLSGYAGFDAGDESYYYTGPMTAGWRQRSSADSSNYYDGTWTTSDGQGITVTNGATASLYTYTPFFSGNNNFDNLFQSTFNFGSVFDVYSWSIVSQYAYTDSNKTTVVDSTKLSPGQKIYVGFTAKNTGDTTWTNSGSSPIHVATTWPNDRSSAFCDPSWLSCNRPAAMKEASVAPGQTGTFEFWYTYSSPGTYREHFSLVAENYRWLNDPGLYFYTVAQPPTYSWSIAGQESYTDASMSTPIDSTNMSLGEKIYLVIKAKNTGNITWRNSGSSPMRLGTSSPLDRASTFCDSSWLSCNRPALMTESSVAPGGTATFDFWYKPSHVGVYSEFFKPVADGVGWTNDTGLHYYTVVHFGTSGTTSSMNTDQTLNAGDSIVSSDGYYELSMQADGNLVLYSINHPLWSSRTAGKPITKAIMQDDGNLVLYDSQGKPYWSSRTAGRGSSHLVMQTDGNLVIYDSSNHPVWSSGTNGQL